MAGLGQDRRFHRNLAVQDVAGDFQVAGTVGAGEAFPGRHRDHVGDPLGRQHGGGELGDRRHHVDVGQVLQRAHLVLGERALAADVQDRAFGTERRGDAGDGVGAPRSRGGDGAAQLAGLAGIAVGGVGGRLFVADVDDADVFIQAAVVNVDDVAAAKGEDGIDAFGLERLGNQVPAGDEVSGLVFFRQSVRCCAGHVFFLLMVITGFGSSGRTPVFINPDNRRVS